MTKEYALWGTKNGTEDIITVNGEEVQKSLATAKNIKKVLERRGEFTKIRIQTINTKNDNIKELFSKTIKK